MRKNELKKGSIYGDRDGVNMYEYIGEEIALYDFYELGYDEDKGDYIRTAQVARLTEREVKELREW